MGGKEKSKKGNVKKECSHRKRKLAFFFKGRGTKKSRKLIDRKSAKIISILIFGFFKEENGEGERPWIWVWGYGRSWRKEKKIRPKYIV